MVSQKDIFNAKWIEPLTDLFVSLLVKEVKKGNRTSCTYNKVGWNNIRVEFIKQSGCQYTLFQLKNKVNKLRKQYSSFKKLVSQSGFGWDNVNKTVVVDDPSVWESHIKDNSEWTKFKKDRFPQYPELCIVFSGTYATRDHAIGNAKDLTVSEESDNGGGNADDDPDDLSDHHIDETVFTSGNSVDPVHDKHKLDRIPNTKRRRKNTSFCIADTCKAIHELNKTKTSQSVNGSATSRVTQSPMDPFFVSAVIDSLLSMPDLGPNLYSEAVERACISATWREAFIKTPAEWKNALLQSL